MNETVMVGDKELRVGDFVCFEAGIEQGGWIDRIKGNLLFLRNPNGFSGTLAGSEVAVVRSEGCWI